MSTQRKNSKPPALDAAKQQLAEKQSRQPSPPPLRFVRPLIWATSAVIVLALVGVAATFWAERAEIALLIGFGLLGLGLLLNLAALYWLVKEINEFGSAVEVFAEAHSRRDDDIVYRVSSLRADLYEVRNDTDWTIEKMDYVLPSVRQFDDQEERLKIIIQLLVTIRGALEKVQARKSSANDRVARRLSSALKKVLDELHIDDLAVGWSKANAFNKELEQLDKGLENLGVELSKSDTEDIFDTEADTREQGET